ncbi:hypothetical protein MJH12_08205 [bacterium]|nr:hypothetical protein [bacterium]
MYKKCSRCTVDKDINDFGIHHRKSNGDIYHRSECKECCNKYSKLKYAKNPDERIEYSKQYAKNNKEIIKTRRLRHYQLNKEKERARIKKNRESRTERQKEMDKIKTRKYYIANRERIIKYQIGYDKKKRDIDPAYRLRSNISKNIRTALHKKGSSKQGQSILKFLPYTIVELRKHLELQFDGWMSWNNWGKYNPNIWNDKDQSTWTWEMDHIIPQSTLPYDSMNHDNFQKCWSLDNLRPLSAKQNLLDGASRIRH